MSCMMSVPTLQAACLTTISTELWNTWDGAQLLASDTVHPDYNKKVSSFNLDDRVITKIMAQNDLPQYLKLQVSIAFYEHHREMMEWAKDLKRSMVDCTVPNIKYGIAKAIIKQTGGIDKATTILKIIFDSFLRVTFKALSCCCIDKKVMRYFIKSQKYSKYWKWAKALKQRIRSMCPLKKLNEVFWMYPFHRHRTDTDKLLMIEAYKNTAPQVWDYVLTKLQMNNPEMYSLSLVYTILTKKDGKKIVHLYEQLDENLQTTVLKKIGKSIVKTLFTDNEILCVKLFERLCRDMKGYFDTEACAKLLLDFLMCSLFVIVPAYPQTTQIVRMRSQQLFLKVWNQTPDNVKQEFLMKHEYFVLSMISIEEHWQLLSIFVNDDAFSKQEKDKIVLATVARLAKNPQDIEKCLDKLPIYYNTDFVKENLKCILKQIIRTSEDNHDYRALMGLAFQSNDEADEFKRNLFKDKDFITSTLATLALINEENMMTFLKWGFNDDKSALEQFIEEKIRSDCWLLDIYKKYVKQSSSYAERLLNMFLVRPKQYRKFKKILREDKDVLRETFQISGDGRHLLKCICDKGDKKQKSALVEEYFASETGQNSILEMLTNNFGITSKHVGLYLHYGVPKVIKQMFQFKINWLVSKRLREIIFHTINHEKILEYINKNRSDRQVYLPFESDSQYMEMVNANYIIFREIMYGDTRLKMYYRRMKCLPDMSFISVEDFLNRVLY